MTMKKILIIEDEDIIRENLLEFLSENYQAIEAKDGSQGIELAVKYQPDLILCDVMMPEMTGYEVKETLNKNPATTFTPFIFLTAKTSNEDLRAGMELGADDYITKPFTLRNLTGAIETRLEKATAFEELIRTREADVRAEYLKLIPDEYGDLLNQIIHSYQLALDERASQERQQILEEGLRAAGRLYGKLWSYFRALRQS
jgi:DNA-binding response OmpR family regulator